MFADKLKNLAADLADTCRKERALLFVNWRTSFSVLAIIVLALVVYCSRVVWLIPDCDQTVEPILKFTFVFVPVACFFGIWRKAASRFSRVNIPRLNRNKIASVIYLLIQLETRIGIENVSRNRPRRPGLMFMMWFKKWTTKRIAGWMGLVASSVNVRVTALENGVAGRAVPSDGTILINKSSECHPRSFLSTICHELAHIFMYRTRIHASLVADEEELTDMICVYLGLGDVMLNGCVSTYTESTYLGGNTVRVRTETLRVGYVTPYELALAELIVRRMGRGCKCIRKSYDCASLLLMAYANRQLYDLGFSLDRPKGMSALDYLRHLQDECNNDG